MPFLAYLQDYYADSFKQEAVASTMDRITTWRNSTVGGMLHAEELEHEGSMDELSGAESEDDETEAGQQTAAMVVDLAADEPDDDVAEELRW